MNASFLHVGVMRRAVRRTGTRYLAFLVCTAGSLIVAQPSLAVNVLVNPGFEANDGHVVPQGWKYFSAPTPPGYFGNYWVENRAGVPHSGSRYWKQWGALYDSTVTNTAGIEQSFGSAPGSVYEAGGWIYTANSDLLGADCAVWLEVAFLNSATNLLALYQSDVFSSGLGSDTWFYFGVTNACDLSAPQPDADPYYQTYAVTGSVSQLVAPVGTASVRYRFAYAQSGSQGGSAYLDDAVLDQVSGPIPPVITNLFPLNMIFVDPSDGVSFQVMSPSGFAIENANINLSLNGVDVSNDLAITGSGSARSVIYSGLQSNLAYTVSITVTDAFGFSASASTYFETMWVGTPRVVYLWEAEDFDFEGGKYLNHPDLCSAPGNSNCYFGKVGIEGVDEHKVGSGGDHLYRPEDQVATYGSGDYLRKPLFAAGRLDYKIGAFQGGEWLNYTRDWPAGTNWVIARVANGGGSGTLTLSEVNPDSSTTDLGTFRLENGRGWATYDNVFLHDENGNRVALALNGKRTLRVTTGGNVDVGLFMLVQADLDLPVVEKLYPSGKIPFEYTNALSFAVTSLGGSISATNIKVLMDGMDISSALVISGSPSARQVVYPGLEPNALHTAVITATNDTGRGVALTNQFDTFAQTNYLLQAEDFDYDGGKFIDNPEPEVFLTVPDSIPEIDFHHTPAAGEVYFYRAVGIPNQITSDVKLQKYVELGATDYNLGWFAADDWANYTRHYPTGTFKVYARAGGSGNYTLSLDKVVQGAGTANQVVERLGQWTGTGRDWQVYDWVPLLDENSAPAVISLGGLATLRVTTTGNSNPNYFLFVPAAVSSGITLSAARSGGNVVISFATQPGVQYRVLYRDNLSADNWTLLSNVAGDGGVQSVSDPATGQSRFYRVASP